MDLGYSYEKTAYGKLPTACIPLAMDEADFRVRKAVFINKLYSADVCPSR